MTTRPMKMRPAELVLVSCVTKSELINYINPSPTAVAVVQVAKSQLSPRGVVYIKSLSRVKMAAGAVCQKWEKTEGRSA
jgi:hypothetical protein